MGNSINAQRETNCVLPKGNKALGTGVSTSSDIHGVLTLPAHSVAVRRQRKLSVCAVFYKGGTTGFPSAAIALPTTPQDSKWAINVFSMALYQAYATNYSPVPIISQAIAPLFCPANCTKGGRGEGGRRGETPISTRLDFTRDGKCLFSWK